MLAEGINVATVSKQLGHADINVTLRRYGHAIKEKNREASNKLADAIKNRKRNTVNPPEVNQE